MKESKNYVGNSLPPTTKYWIMVCAILIKDIDSIVLSSLINKKSTETKYREIFLKQMALN